MQLRVEIDDVLAGLRYYGTSVHSCLNTVGRNAASRMEDYAKQNRPWTDRTGNARRTMEGVFAWDPENMPGHSSGDICSVGVEGHMPYSVFLELGYGGRYSVLAPTVHHFAPAVLLELADGIGSVR